MAMCTSRDSSLRDYDAEQEHGDDLSSTEHPTLQNKAFDDITTEIRSTVDRLFQLYQKRYHMYMSHVKCDAALRDAHAMCDIDPQSPLGYLCVGEVYRQQCRQQKAIDIYSLGLKKASTQHPSYSSLIQAKEDATSQLDKRVDFISQLPIEIVSQHIVPTIMKHQPWDMYNQWPYLHVSQTWRNRLLQSASLHYELHEPSKVKVEDANQVDKFKDYIGSVTLHQFRGDDDQVLPWQSGRSLRRLEIYEDITYPREHPSNPSPILMAVGDRLTHLRLSLDYQHYNTPTTRPYHHLEQILEHAPHLRMLIITHVIVKEWESNNIYPKLTNLAIHAPPDPMTHSNVMSVLEHCPSLRALSMFRCNQSPSLRVIHDYCPMLIYLRYSPETGEYEDDYLDFDSYNFGSNTKPGLTNLHLVANYTIYDISDVISLLQQQHSTLEEIRIRAWLDTTGGYDRDMNVSFPSLKALDLTGHCNQSAHMYQWILKHAPNLRNLTLAISSTAIADPVSNNITTLSMCVMNDTYFQVLDRIVSQHMNLKQHSCLKHLTLTFSRNVSGYEAVIQNIGDLIQLDTLSIDVCDVGYNNAFDIMLDKFASRDHPFSSLSWKANGAMLNYVLQHIQRMNHIKDLTLGNEISESDLLHVLHCKPQRSLTMDYMDDIPEQTLDMLHERFKNISLNLTAIVY
ncbi:hypothetical protein LRAMOSA02309 [Lichtheimia ramosa]|uniref:F-box domain-containing protein n=1 Tax=Lichtheimia ramosa TaxID=688394 RepID=A0A077WKU5_9FUNG|nr:hypothetical protein LRAMOSA02309 [Lichtheimia ramosa]